MKEVIFDINNRLRKFGREAIQESNIPGRGKVIGYRPQYIIDAVNSVLGPENWRYEIVTHNIERGEKMSVAWVMLRLFIRTPGGEWLVKGEHFGHAHVTMGAIGDALKAATTDALGKCFSTMSVGRDAYSGALTRNNGHPIPVKERPTASSSPEVTAQASPEVAPVSVEEESSREPEAKPATQAAEEISPEELGIPAIPGVKFLIEDATGTVVATGATYQNRNLLRNVGFRFDKDTKRWVSQLPGVDSECSGEDAEPPALPDLEEKPVGYPEIPF